MKVSIGQVKGDSVSGNVECHSSTPSLSSLKKSGDRDLIGGNDDLTDVVSNKWCSKNYYSCLDAGICPNTYDESLSIGSFESHVDSIGWTKVKKREKPTKSSPPVNKKKVYSPGYNYDPEILEPMLFNTPPIYFASIENQFPAILYYLHINKGSITIRKNHNDSFKYRCIETEVFYADMTGTFPNVYTVKGVVTDILRYSGSISNYETTYRGYKVVVGYNDFRKYISAKKYKSHAEGSAKEASDLFDDMRALLSGAVSSCVDKGYTDEAISTIVVAISKAYMIYTLWDTPYLTRYIIDTVLCSITDTSVRKYLDAFMENNKHKVPKAATKLVSQSEVISEAALMMRNPLLDHIDTVIATLIYVGLIEKEHVTVAGVEFFATSFPKHTTARDIGCRVLDAIAYLSEVITECVTKRSFEPIRDTKSDLASFARNVTDIENKLPSIIHGNFDSIFEQKESQFTELLTNTVQQAEKINRLYVNAPAPTLAYIRVLCAKLHNANDTYRVDQFSRGSRIRPLCMKYYGDTGRGKSYINQHSIIEVLKYNVYPCEPKNITVVTDEKFDTTIKSNTTGVIMDDMANTVPERDEFNPAAKLIRFVNNVCAPAVKAEAQDKGKVLLQPKVVGITTNCRELAAQYWSICPSSILRRCDVHVDVYLRPEFINEAGLLNSPKVGEYYDEKQIHDIYVLRVMYYDIETQQLKVFRYIDDGRYPEMHMKLMEGVSIMLYYHWLYRFSEEFFFFQTKLQNTMKMMYEAPRCTTCRRHKDMCICVAPQHKFPICTFIPAPGMTTKDAIAAQRNHMLAYKNNEPGFQLPIDDEHSELVSQVFKEKIDKVPTDEHSRIFILDESIRKCESKSSEISYLEKRASEINRQLSCKDSVSSDPECRALRTELCEIYDKLDQCTVVEEDPKVRARAALEQAIADMEEQVSQFPRKRGKQYDVLTAKLAYLYAKAEKLDETSVASSDEKSDISVITDPMHEHDIRQCMDALRDEDINPYKVLSHVEWYTLSPSEISKAVKKYRQSFDSLSSKSQDADDEWDDLPELDTSDMKLESQAFQTTIHGFLFEKAISSVTDLGTRALTSTYFHLQTDPYDAAMRKICSIDLTSYIRDYHDGPFAWNNWLPDDVLRGVTSSWLGRKFAQHSIDRSVYKSIRFWATSYMVSSNALLFSCFGRRVPKPLLILNLGVCGLLSSYKGRVTRTYLEEKLLIDREVFESQCDQLTKEAVEENRLTGIVKWGLNIGGLAVLAIGLSRAYNAVGASFFKMSDQSALEPNQAEFEIRMKDKNVWTGLKISSYISKASTKTSAQFANTIQKSLRYIIFKQPDGKECGCNAIFLRTDELMLPRHVFQVGVDVKGSDVEYIDYKLIRSEIGKEDDPIPGSIFASWKRAMLSDTVPLGPDWVVLKTCSLSGDVRDLTKPDGSGTSFFVKENELHTATLLTTVHRNRMGVPIVHECSSAGKTMACPTTNSTDDPKAQRALVTTDRNWVNGDCGTVVFTRSKSPAIVGFHLYASETLTPKKVKLGYAYIITQEMIDAYVSGQQRPWLVSHCISPLPESINSVKVECRKDAPKHSPIHYVSGNYDVLGHSRGNDHYTTELRPTRIYKMVSEKCSIKYEPPDFKNSRPFDDYLTNSTSTFSYLRHDTLRIAADDYLSQLMERRELADYMRKYIRPLSNSQIINGVDGVRFIDRMKGSSAMGFPYTGRRDRYWRDVGISPSGSPIRDWIDQSIWTQFDKYHDVYRSGYTLSHPFKSSLKDELRKSTKTMPRVFQAAPLFLQLFIRKYFLPLALFLSSYPLQSECAVGINCFSLEWHEMMEHVSKYGKDRVFAGDYSKWDMKFEKELANAVYYVLIKLAESFGYSQDDLLIMNGIKTDLMNPVLLLFGTYFRLPCSNPSGQNMTAYVNSIGNSIKVRYMNILIQGEGKFNSRHSLMTYGDDMICGVAPGSNLNFTTYRIQMEKHGQKFTLPTKKEIVNETPFLPWDECDFLKRKSVFIPLLGYNVGAIELDSIYKSLLYYNTSSSESEEHIVKSTLESASFEFAAHGEQIYVEGISFLRRCAQAYHMETACSFLNTPFHLKVDHLKTQDATEPVTIGYHDADKAWLLDFLKAGLLSAPSVAAGECLTPNIS